jgi:uncharacterized repeat protein (TIGR01451 family)
MFVNTWGRWLRGWSRTLAASPRREKGRVARRRLFGPEYLEDRVVPTIYNVTTTTDFAIPSATANVNFANGQIQGTGGAADGQVTLRSAIIASNHVATTSNTINVPAGTYKITQGPADNEGSFAGGVEETGDFNIFQNNLTITGAGDATTIIDGNNIDRIFNIQSAASSEVPNGVSFTLSGVTLQNAHAPTTTGFNELGGAIQFDGTGNSTTPAVRGVLTLSNDIIKNNTAEGTGGGLYAQFVGGISLTNVTFDSNTSNQSAGGAFYYLGDTGDGNISITSCLFNNNKATTAVIGSGGAIRVGVTNAGNSFTIADSTFSNNQAGTNGGAVSDENGTNASPLIISNSTFAGNSAGVSGGGVFVDDTAGGSAKLTSVTLTNNRANTVAGGLGGGIDQLAGTVTLANTIIAGNFTGASGTTADDAKGMYSTTSSYDLFGTGGSGNLTSGNTSHNLFSVANPGLAPLGSYGGSTQTVGLLPGSPALDAGDNLDASTTDERGSSRDVDLTSVPDPDPGDATDIGAFESHGFTVAVVSGNNQMTTTNTAFPSPLVVSVTPNDAGVPVNGGVVTFTGPGAGASINPNPVTATVAGGQASANVTANGTAGSYTVNAAAGGNSAGFTLTNLAPSADLAVTKTGPATVTAGANITYGVTVTNLGPGAAQSVTLTDTLPSGETFSSQSQNTGPAFTLGHTGNAISDTISTLAAGASATFTFVATVNANQANGTTLTNTAIATTTTTDPTPTDNNNTGTTSAMVTTSADLSIGKTGTAAAVAGQNVTYTLSVTNNGPSDAQNVMVTDTLPTGETFVSASTGSGAGTTYSSGNLGTLAASASTTITIVAMVSPSVPSGSMLTNTATVSSSTTDPTSADNTATFNTTVSTSADVAITKTGPSTVTAGVNVTYSITTTNNGPSDAQGVTTSDTLPGNTTQVSFVQNTGPTNGGPLPAGGQQTFTLVLTVNANAPNGTMITNTANVATGTPDPTSADNTSTVTSTVATSADLAVSKTGPANITAGDNITYTVSVTNNGPSDSQGVSLTDTLPTGETFMSQGQSTGPSFTLGNTGNAITDTISTLAAGASATFTFVASTSTSTGGMTLNNTAMVSSSGTTDPTPGNNSSMASTMVAFAFTTDVTYANDTITVTDLTNSRNDNWKLQSDTTNSQFVISDPTAMFKSNVGTVSADQHSVTIPFSVLTTGPSMGSATPFQLNTLGGNDAVTVDYSLGNFFDTIGYDGGTGSNSLKIAGGTFTTTTYDYTNAHNGDVKLATAGPTATINYQNLAPITNTGTAANIIFNLPAGAAGASLQDDGTLGNNTSQLASTNATFETTTFTDPTNSLTLNGGGGSDTITTAANFSGDFKAGLTINGTAATDQVTLNALNLTTGTHNLSVTANTLSVAGAVSVAGSGTVNLTTSGGTGDILINAAVSSGSGTIMASSGHNIAFGTGGSMTTGVNVTLTSTNAAGTITQSTGATSVINPGFDLFATAPGGIGAAAQSFVFNVGTLRTNSSASNGNQWLADTATAGLNVANALNAGTGTINLTSGTFQVRAGAVTSGSNTNAIADTSPLVIASPGGLDLNGFSEQVTTLSGNGTVTSTKTGATGELQAGVNNGTGATFSGVLQDGSGTAFTAFRKIGSGTQTLSGNNTSTGPTNLDGGTLTVSGALNNNAVATAGLVDLNAAGVTLNGSGTIKGQVTVNASSSGSPTNLQAVTVSVPTTSGGTGITVVPGARFVQIGVTGGGVTVNRLVAANTGTVGIDVLGSARIENSTIGDPASATKGHHVGVLVDGGGAAAVGGLDGVAELQSDHVDNDAASGGLDSGLQVQHSAVVDAGQLTAAATPLPGGPANNRGDYGDITGLFSGTPLGSTAHSSGNNTFNGYTLDTSATATPNPGPAIPQAIRNLNSGTASFGPLANGVELSFNYGAVGPQLGRMDLPAQNNTFNGNASLPLFQVEQLIFHDVDDASVGFVTFGTPGAAPTVVGNVLYSANFSLGATQGGTSTLLPGAGSVLGDPNFANGQKSLIRYIQVTFNGLVYLDPSPGATASNLGLNLVQVNGPAFKPGNTNPANGQQLHASLFSTVYNRTNGNYTVTYSFKGPGWDPGALADGNYSLQFNESAIHGGGPGGPTLSPAGDPFSGSPGKNSGPALFWRFFGDSDGNRVVDDTDLAAFQAAFQARQGVNANYRAYFDYNADNVINTADYYQVLQRRNFKGGNNPHGYQLNADGTVSAVP